MSRLQADVLIFFAAAIWGVAFVFQKTAMDAIGPLTFIAARSIVAALALAPLALRETRQLSAPPERAFLNIVGVAGIAFFLGAALQQYGLLTATVSNTGFLTALYVVLVPFIVWGWTGTRPAPLVWLAALLSFIGIWLLGGASVSAFNHGDALVALCAIFWAAHVVITGHAGRFARPITFTCLQFCIVAALAVIGAVMTETISFSGLKAAWVEIAYVGLLSSALTFTLISIALRYAPPSEAAILMSTENLFAAGAAALMLGERLGWISWLGAGVIMVATLLIQLAPRKPTPSGLNAKEI